MHLPLLCALLGALSPSVPPRDAAADLLALVRRAEAKAHRLQAKLATCKTVGQDVACPDAALAVAELFCRYSRYDAQHPDMVASALKSMTYVDGLLDGELRNADQVLARRASYPAVPRWSTLGVTWHDGAFWTGKEPVFLSGLNWDAAEAQHDPDLVRRLGITLVDSMFRGARNPDGSFDDAGYRGGDGAFLARMAHAGLPVDCLYGFGIPGWLASSTPGLAQPGYGNGCDDDLEHPAALRYREQVIGHYAPLYAAEPSFFAVDLANEPAFQGPSPTMFAEWRAWLRRKYGTTEAMNRAWGTHLGSFDEVVRYPSQPESMKGPWDRAAVDFARPGMRGMHYDWCAFNNERISKYFRSVSDLIHARAPKAATHVKVMMGLYFTGSTEARGWPMDLSYHTFGVDPEALARSCSLLGGDLDLTDLAGVEKPNRRFGCVPYVCGWLDAALSADFLKSLAPRKPFYDSEFHAVEDNKPTGAPAEARAHLEMALWLAHLHGMCGNLLWYWGRDASGAPMGTDWFRGSVMQQPWVLQGYVQESLSLRRFVRPVMAFARGPRAVRLLYSEASAIQDVHYLDALRDAYEALNFLGVHIGFITERQLAEAGVPPGTRLVIVPNARYVQDTTVPALRAAARKGIRVGIIGAGSLTAVPTGGERPDGAVPGSQRMPVSTPQDYHAAFAEWLAAAGVTRDLTAVDARGRPAWGVETRTARLGGQRLAYLVNLMRAPQTVALRWRRPGTRLRDWRSGATITQRVTLQPRQVVFGSFR